MSALAISDWGASVYAPQQRKEKPVTAATLNTVAFAPQERVAPVLHLPRITEIPVGSEKIGLTIDRGTMVPSWIKPTIDSMMERWGSYPGWDSYDARPTDLDHAIKLLNYLSQTMPVNAIAPIITPLADGGLQAEWHRGDKDIEIVVSFGEPARYYYFDAITDIEEDDELGEGNIETVRNRINNL